MSEAIPFGDPDEEGITAGMRLEAERLSAGLAEQAIRTSQQAVRILEQLEMAIEREQEVYKGNEVVHECLGAIRAAINEVLEEEAREE